MAQESEPLPQSPHLGLEVAPTDQRLRPGGQAVFQINIANRTGEAQSQSLELRGLPEKWFMVDFDERRVAFPQEQRRASLMVSVPEDAEPARHPFRVVARAGTEETAVQCSLEVLAAAEVSATPPDQPPPRREERPPAPIVSLSQALVTWGGDVDEIEHLTVTVRNEGSADTDYTLSLEGLSEAWYTLTRRLRVRAGATMNTVLDIHPPAGTDIGDYPFRVSVAVDEHADIAAEAQGRLSVAPPAPVAPPQPPEGQADTPTGPVAMPPDVSLERTTFDFGPGVLETNVLLTVQNKSNLIEHYEIQVMGIPDNWHSLQTTDLRLEPGARQEVLLRLTPQTGPGLPAGDYDFRVRVAPSRFPDSFRDVGGRMSIAGVAAFDGRLSPGTARGRKEKFKLTLANKGSIPLSLTVNGSDMDAMCKFGIPPLSTLEPGEDRIVAVWVGAARNGLLGPPETFDFRLRVAPAGASESTAVKTFDAQFVHHPFLASRFAFLSIAIAFLIAVIGVILSLGTPRIADGFDWVDCNVRGNEYQRVAGGADYKKQKCGGDSEYLQCTMLNDQVNPCYEAADAPPDVVRPSPTPTATLTPVPTQTASPTDGATTAPNGTAGPTDGATTVPNGTATPNACATLGEGCKAVVGNIESNEALGLYPSASIAAVVTNALLDGLNVCITGPATEADGLTWWPVRATNEAGTLIRDSTGKDVVVGTVEGWAYGTAGPAEGLLPTGEPCD